MGDLTFRDPSVLWVAVPLSVAAIAWQWRRRRTYLAFSGGHAMRGILEAPSSLRRLPVMATAIGFALLVVAAMDPVVPYAESQVQARGLDVVLVVDLSSSMQEIMGLPRPTQSMATLTFSSRDNAPRRLTGKTRLDTTKAALKDLISRRTSDRIGLIVFSDHAYLISPLTFDHDNLYKYVDMIDDQILRGEGMTAIGDGVAMATQLLARQSADPGDHKLIVVFTDGENNTGRDPLAALGEADAAGIRIHVIGIDLEDEVKKKPTVLQLITRVRQYGGQYFNADTERELQAAYGRIDAMEKARLTSTAAVHSDPAFDRFAKPAAALIAMAMLMRAIPIFRDLT